MLENDFIDYLKLRKKPLITDLLRIKRDGFVHISRCPGSIELGESKLNLWRFGQFCTHLFETHTIVLEDVLRLVR